MCSSGLVEVEKDEGFVTYRYYSLQRNLIRSIALLPVSRREEPDRAVRTVGSFVRSRTA
jgi:hypothetical protein